MKFPLIKLQNFYKAVGHAMFDVTGCFSLWRPRFIPWPGHVGFVVDRVAL